ncbi:MAG: protein kinase domain-containing protein [Planctomycetota bacterium]|jgi:serine/threonine protein kinase/Tol biopolymer transport system component
MPADIGPYHVDREIGRGGMGVVYLATDTKLDRQVAIKVLPDQWAADAERLARFEREARSLAQLNHSNIAGIYRVEEQDERRFLILEYVDGETLADRLALGALPVRAALALAIEIASGVEAAHRAGVVHRDLKPENIKVASDGTVKVLDFGLAKAVEDRRRTDGANRSTIITDGSPTVSGVVLGTPGYLSPEQARGQAVDERSDIFAFGCVLYEMLAGRHAFGGATASDAIAALLEREPDWDALPPGLPPLVQRVLRRCLEKDRRRRAQAMGDVRLDLEEASDPTSSAMFTAPSAARSRSAGARIAWLVAALLAVALVLVSLNRLARPPSDARALARQEIALPPGAGLGWTALSPTSLSSVGYSRQVALSRDGARLLCAGQAGDETALYMKDRDTWALTPIAGTEGARAPFCSPDGESIGFLQDMVLKTFRLPDGPALAICTVISTGFDATWSPDGTIIYATDDGLWRVNDDGLSDAEPIALSDPDADRNQYRFPHVSPDGRWLFLTIVNESGVHAAVAPLGSEDPDVRIICSDASDARLVGSGHIVFARGTAILAAPFDPERPRAIETPDPIAFDVHTTPGHYGLVVAHFSTSESGALAYAPAAEAPGADEMLWLDPRTGDTETIVRGEGKWRHPRLSPQGDRILFDIQDADGTRDLFIVDLERPQRNQLTHRSSCFNAEWSPDGRHVVYCAGGANGRDVYRVATDFSGEDVLLLPSVRGTWPHLSSWTSDGTTLLFWERARGGTWSMPAGGGELRPLVQTQANERWAVLSPQRDLIAYVADEQDTMHVYVQHYPALGSRVRVTDEGGGEPVWSRDANERKLYFRRGDGILSTEIRMSPTLSAGPSRPVSEGTYDIGPPGHQHFDVALDGRFIMMKEGERHRPERIRVIEHWPHTRSP